MYVGARRPEVAFAVADAWQGHGIATILLAHLAHAAASAGIDTFRAIVLPENRRMLQVFHDSGFPMSTRRVEDSIEAEFPTSLSRAARERFEERQRAADVAAVAHVLRPASVAVIGASRREGTVGNAVVRNLLAAGYAGPLHLVNAKGGEVGGRPTVRSIAEVEDDVELAVIAVPARAVVGTARQCADKGVRALVVLTAGFAEVGAEGRARHDELLTVCRAAGMRMVGPNCLGVANLHHQHAFNATFAPGEPTPGGVAFASQSGAFGIAAIDEAAARGIGLSSFVSMGNKADLSGNDFLEYWQQDPDTAVLLLYLESFGNPRRFGRIARRITNDKPIVAVKSGRTAAGQRAASSHTGALLAASDVTVDALFAHAGVLRAETVGEMFDVAGVLARQPLPRGDRVAVLTNAGGPGILCADACEAEGLRIQPLPAATRARLAEALPPEASTANPVDMIASATADQYERSLRVLLEDDEVDAVVTIFVRPLAARAAAVARAIASAAEGSDRPVLAVWLGADIPGAADTGEIPRFATPEEAVRALGHAVRYARHRAAPADPPFEPADADVPAAATIVAEGLARGGGWLPPGRRRAAADVLGDPRRREPACRYAARRGTRRRRARRPGGAQGCRARARPQERCRRRAARAHRPDGGDARGARARGAARRRRGVPRPADGAGRDRADRGRSRRSGLRAAGRVRRGRRGGRVARRRPGPARPARPARGGRHAARAQDLPAARRLPRARADRSRLAARPRDAHRRLGRRAPGDRRARSQPRHRHAGWRSRRRCAGAARGPRAGPGVPLAQRLTLTVDYGADLGRHADGAAAGPA